MKRKTGYTTPYNANLAKIRQLEKLGKATDEQLEILYKDREKKRISEAKRKDRIRQSKDKS